MGLLQMLTGWIYSIISRFVYSDGSAISWMPFWQNKQPKIEEIAWIEDPKLQEDTETVQNDFLPSPFVEAKSLNLNIEPMTAIATKVNPYVVPAASEVSYQSVSQHCSLDPVFNQTKPIDFVPEDEVNSTYVFWIFIFSLFMTVVVFILWEACFVKIKCCLRGLLGRRGAHRAAQPQTISQEASHGRHGRGQGDCHDGHWRGRGDSHNSH
ncbi:uncharacterized protein LOC117585377 [Drosophila guanche]|uniref:uncharacterized protein LOC117585377 n=1 Tax=Drosophila guanche TaxID=7266 RepID=UPI001471D767|nr:uncharacterized protein LOC117585377 [Drosophila guanche]